MDRPNPSAPAACKVRLRYAKRGKLRFTSHRDVARAFERALRRAGLPMAYSQGFNPHPKVSWVGAAPTGAASEAEYVEIQLISRADPAVVCTELDRALPDGLAVLDGVLAGPGSLADRIEAAEWRIEIPGVSAEQLRSAIPALLAAPELMIERVTKDGRRSIDARAAIVSLRVGSDSPQPTPSGAGTTGRGGGEQGHGTVAGRPPAPPPVPDQFAGCGILIAVVRQASPAVRPDDVLSALGVVAGFRPSAPARATRIAQGRLDDDGGLVDPLAADRVAARMAPAESGGKEPDQHDVAGHAS
ncbi:MAG TPA: TIGR03936 family radical SAM-associated protein [Pseudonocardiaceae bacterium]